MNAIILSMQRATFYEELDTLFKEGNVNKKSPLVKLNPLIDDDGLLRVGGRLKLADLSS